jgi:hypothetical protein
MISTSHDFGLLQWETEISVHDFWGDIERLGIHELVFQKDDWVRVTDRGFQKTPRVLDIVTGDNLKAWDVGVPTGEALGMLGSNRGRWAIKASEDYRAAQIATGHVLSFSARVNNLIDSL